MATQVACAIQTMTGLINFQQPSLKLLTIWVLANTELILYVLKKNNSTFQIMLMWFYISVMLLGIWLSSQSKEWQSMKKFLILSFGLGKNYSLHFSGVFKYSQEYLFLFLEIILLMLKTQCQIGRLCFPHFKMSALLSDTTSPTPVSYTLFIIP